MTQRELILRSNSKDVSDEIVSARRTWKDALRLCKEISGLTDNQITQELGIDPAQWSRIWSGSANFPDDKLETFMGICGNIVPIRYLAMKFGRGLHMLESEMELAFKEEKAARIQAEEKLATITEFMKHTGRG